MERLTERDEKGLAFAKNPQAAISMFEKLAQYEDLEEQGLLIKLPCKAGDKIWCIGDKCETISEEECDEIEECDDCPYYKETVVYERECTAFILNLLMTGKSKIYSLNETVFLTKEEAEKKLEEMKQKSV